MFDIISVKNSVISTFDKTLIQHEVKEFFRIILTGKREVIGPFTSIFLCLSSQDLR